MRRRASSSLYLQSPEETVLPVLLDYERYEEWVPGITKSRLLAQEDERSIVEVSSPHGRSRRLLFEISSITDSRLQLRQVGRYRRGGLSAHIELEGSDKQGGVNVSAHASMQVPLLSFLRFSGIGKRDLSRGLEALLHALDLRVQRAAMGTLPKRSQSRNQLLEVKKTDEGFVVSFGDKTLRLRADDSSGKEQE